MASARDWSNSKPRQPGWYWYRGLLSEGEPIVVRVNEEEDILLAGPWPGGQASLRVDLAFGEWIGPIEPPA